MRAILTLSAATLLAGLSLPALAQLGLPGTVPNADRATGPAADGGDRSGRPGPGGATLAGQPGGLFFGGFSGQGLNPGRAGALDQGLRVTPALLQGLPSPPQLAPRSSRGAPAPGTPNPWRRTDDSDRLSNR